MPPRTLSLFDLLCLGINAIVGSGIYAFPGILAEMLGPISFLAFGCCGIFATLIGLCFAEAAGMFERSGGPYIYTRESFGAPAGYLVGWACWAAAIVSWAAVARAIPPYLGQFWAPLGAGPGELIVAVGIVLSLGLINVLGIKPGAIIMDVLTVGKLLPLLLIAGVGLLRPRPALGPLAPHGFGPLPKASFTAFFAFQGFEVVPVPASDTANPRRNAPLGVLGALAGSTLLYMVIQWVAVTTTPNISGAKQPLAEVGQVLFGAVGGQMIAAAAVISMLGFCAGVALAGPRYVEALALDGWLPERIAARHPRLGTPHLSIALTTVLTAVFVAFLGFAQLVDLAVLTVSVQYLATCTAIPVLRHKRADLPRSLTLPLGPTLPLLATGVTLWLGLQAGRQELWGFMLLCATGLLPPLIKRFSERWIKNR